MRAAELTGGDITVLARRCGDLAVLVDEPPGDFRATVVLAPPFGVSARHMFVASHVLALNGFRVVRFDPRDHVGQSPGSVFCFRLSTVAEDLEAVLDWSGATMVVGFSLSAPPVLRALTSRPSVTSGVLVVPVISVRHTMSVVLGVDYFECDHVDLPEMVEVFGEPVSKAFVADCRQHRFVELSDTLRDLSSIRASLTLIVGDRDPWVRADDAHSIPDRVAAGGASVSVRSVSAASHQINLNPTVGMLYLEEAVRTCLELCTGATHPAVQLPPLKDIIDAHVRNRPDPDTPQ